MLGSYSNDPGKTHGDNKDSQKHVLNKIFKPTELESHRQATSLIEQLRLFQTDLSCNELSYPPREDS